MSGPGVRRKWCLGAAVVLCGLACAPSFGEQSVGGRAKTSGTFRVAGLVVSAKTGEPLVHTRVTLVNNKNGREAVSVITQEDGRFKFEGLPAGKYSLQGARRGYIAAAYEQHEQYSTAIVTGESLETQDLTLRLVPMAALTGSVIDENGEAVRAAQVKLYRESHQEGTTRVVMSSSEITDDRGTFEFAAIGPGTYYVAAAATPWYATRSPTSAMADRSLDVVYPMTFYGGSTNSEGAEAIPLRAGEKAEVDIRLAPVPGLRLFMNVGENPRHGYRMPEFQTRVFETLESGQFGGLQSWSSSSPGVMEIAGLVPGRYSVRIPDSGSGEMQQEAEVELKEDGQDVSQWRGEPLASVKLSVKLPKDATPPRQMNIGLQDEHNRTVAYSRVDQNGEAKFKGLAAGRYGIRALATGGTYSVTRMSSAEAQIFGAELRLKPGESQEWSVDLATGKTDVEGLVKRGGKGASGVMVVLIPSEPETHQDLFRRDQSDLDGSFVLRGVVPWSYTVVAIEDAWGFDWSKPTLLERYALHGQRVTIGELMRGTVSLLDAVEVQVK